MDRYQGLTHYAKSNALQTSPNRNVAELNCVGFGLRSQRSLGWRLFSAFQSETHIEDVPFQEDRGKDMGNSVVKFRGGSCTPLHASVCMGEGGSGVCVLLRVMVAVFWW